MNKHNLLSKFTWLLVGYETTSYLANDAYLPALPRIAKDLGTSQSLVQASFTAWFMGAIIFQLIAGPLADRYGRRPVLLTGGLFFLLATLLCTFSPNIYLLLLGRFIQGAVLPSMLVAGYATIHELFEGETAVHILARMQSITVLAPSLGPLLGGAILFLGSWPWIFGLLLISGSIFIGLLFSIMPETLTEDKKITRIHAKIIIYQYARLLINPGFMRNTLTGCFILASMIAWMLAGPFLVVDTFHYSSIYFGISQGIIFSFYIIGTRLIKHFMTNRDRNLFVSIGAGLTLFGAVLCASSAYFFPHSLIGLVGAMCLISLGSGLSYPIVNRLAIESSDLPMGIRVGLYSGFQVSVAALSSTAVSLFYQGTLISLGLIVLGFITTGTLLRLLILNPTREESVHCS